MAYKHELRQQDALDNLKLRIVTLESKSDASNINWAHDGFNYLAIGNSITKHGICDYWWSECGMAASSPEADYFHLVTNYLQNTFPSVVSSAYNFSTWETMSHDRAETLDLISPYLDDELDLITIQLGENVSDDSTFMQDLSELIELAQSSCPQARIILVGDFWTSNGHESVKKDVAESHGIYFLSLSDIADDKKYQAGLDYMVTDSDGVTHSVQHNGVAKHPNDKAMRYIADSIITLLDGMS